jgi:hypothetical protein
LKLFFWKFEKWAGAFGGMGVQHPHFLKLVPTLGSVKCSILHRDWRFYFFSNFIFSEFRVHMDLHIYRWIIVLKKSEITNNLTIYAKVMEMFSTLL